MTLLKALVLRPMMRDRLRSALTVAGVAVGVAVVVAIQLANESALRAFGESVDAVAGRANYQVAADAGLLDEATLLKLQPLWHAGVRFAPVIDIDGIIESPTGTQQVPVRLLAVDLFSDLHFRDYRYAEISIAPAAGSSGAMRYLELFRHDSVVVPAPFAREHALRLGSPVILNVLGRRQTLTVRGILEARGPATAFNGSIAICDIATAQRSFGLAGRLSRIDLLVPEEGASAVVDQVRRVIPAGARIERPSRRNERVEKMLRAFRVNLFALAGVAVLVGMFLVHNTVLISILRRRRDVGIVKTVGASPRQIFIAFVLEGLVLGVAGSLFGVLLGVGLAQAILRIVGGTVNSLYVTSRPEAIELTVGTVVLASAVGVLLSVVSAIQPSREAANVRPDLLIRPGVHQRVSALRSKALAVHAFLCFAAAAGASLLPPVGGIAVAGYVAVLLVVAGFSLLAPIAVVTIARGAAPLLRRMFGPAGRLAAASIPASLRRTSLASAALSVAVGMMVAVALMVGSFRETVAVWVKQTVSSDLWLRPSKGLSNAQAALFPAEILNDLRKVSFVAAFDAVRGRDVVYRDAIVTIGSGEFRVAATHGDLPMVTPRSSRAALENALRTNGVLVSESFATRFRHSLGESVTLPTAYGPRRFPITGIYRDYSNDRGVVAMDRALYIESFHDDAINTIVVYLRHGVALTTARRELERILGSKYHAFTVSNAEIRHEVMKIFDQTFSITWSLLGVAVVVAVLGIINALSALILERTRELALLRVIGVTLGNIRLMLVLESAILGLVSTAVGTAMGYALSSILINVINKQSFGWTIEFHTPTLVIAASLATTFAAAVVAGAVPARLAAGIDIPAAIKME